MYTVAVQYIRTLVADVTCLYNTAIPLRNLEGLCRTAYIHLQRVAKERDHHYEVSASTGSC